MSHHNNLLIILLQNINKLLQLLQDHVVSVFAGHEGFVRVSKSFQIQSHHPETIRQSLQLISPSVPEVGEVMETENQLFPSGPILHIMILRVLEK